MDDRKTQVSEEAVQAEEPAPTQRDDQKEDSVQTNDASWPEADAGDLKANPPQEIPAPSVVETDWSGYFDGLDGAAVIYDPTERCYQIYNKELACTRHSPCSTFKIISSLIALEHGIIEPEDSVRAWSGEIFWNEEWNRDLDFFDAFHASCVWYFREVVDVIGKDRMQKELDRLAYGNQDISDWTGAQNTNNDNPALTGFWIESSLLISPKEQVEVLERIFGEASEYSKESRDALKQAMLLPEQSGAGLSVYGKTGMGKEHGILKDAWFAGFAERDGRRLYFCVYLGETDDERASSAAAREIAVRLVSDFL